VRGWINYYGAFYRSELYSLARRIDEHLVRWPMQKFKRLRGKPWQAWEWLAKVRQHNPRLFRPLARCSAHPRPDCGSRMTGDCHVRFCESGRGRFPPATHPIGGRWRHGTNLRGQLVPGRGAEKRHPMAWAGPQPQQRSAEPAAYLTAQCRDIRARYSDTRRGGDQAVWVEPTSATDGRDDPHGECWDTGSSTSLVELPRAKHRQ
jgi:hypothetical protein